MSIHWTQEQATVYPVVVLRKIDDVLGEDHFTFISDDIKHDVPFVELCNDMIHTYYDEVNVDIDLDIEFNDGCASRFKCIRTIYRFASRNMRCIRVYFETSHGKSKSDGFGGVVKGYSSREVASKKCLNEFCKENLEVTNSEKGKILKRLFFLVSKDDIAAYRENFPPSGIYKHTPGKRKIHQLINQPSGVYKRCFSCLCEYCLSNEFSKYLCIDHETFRENPALIKPQWHILKKKS